MLLEREPQEGRREPRRDFATALVEATPELRRIAGYYVANPDSAEDVVQATLLTAIEREATYDCNRPLVPWLAGILLNKVAALRRERRSRELEPERLLGPSSEAIAASNEIERLVEEGLRQLPPKYRVVLELYLRDGEQGAEIAARLKKPPGTVRAQIHRGLHRLRALLPASLALGTLVALLRPGSRIAATRAASATRAARERMPRGGRGSWLRTNPALSLGVGALALATGGIALSASLDAGRGSLAASTALAAAPPAGELDAAARRARQPVVELEPGASGLAASDAAAASAAAVELLVFDRRSRAPLAGAALAVAIDTRDGERQELAARTDERGNARIDVVPASVERIEVRSSAPGHSPLWSVWNASSTTLDGRAALRVPLQEARPIGGVVVDETGRGIADALVQASVNMLVDDELWITAPEELVTHTDREGRWAIADAPAASGQIHLRIAHPEFASELHYDDRRRPAPEDLWDGTGRIVLERGRPLAARVLDPRGEPVANATVRLLERRDPPQITIQLATDEQGRVEFAAPDEDLYIVQVRAPGFVPAALFLGRDAPAENELRLRPGAPIALQVLDADGLPVADARVRRFGNTWDESVGTDAEGRFQLDVAPGRPSWICVKRPGVFGSDVARVESNTREVRLPRPVRITGAVLDAATGEPVERALLRLLGPDGTEVARVQHAGGTDFGFAFYPSSPSGGSFALEASAVGFQSERLADLAAANGELRLEPRLARAEALELQLVDAAGAPADYASLALCRTAAEVRLENGCMFPSDGERKLFARGDGRVRMNRPEGEFALAVVGQEGFAYVRDAEIPDDGRVVMRRFGRVEGRGEPGEEFRLEPLSEFPGLVFDYTTRADELGRYQFRSVPSGLVRVHPAADPERAVVVDVPSGAAVAAP